ncbi:actin-binding LIM protein 3 isoform X9 [Bombus vosnesenskii]|uniref:Actin-binding LIM protein 3 isoform X9 n=2 Tax=Pyrobombus TaxID=144703 RepID=A0A6J3L6X1_9HYME|nr:actin-binding LIM protein 3 isoform X9 [Bombus vancouverensis nearcticus]XP_033310283.1 actin-binding LIM protein 3 isoform X9 [Bombus bifarius]XP_033360990.1 actin-binding LIM protein 3 isoform X9 [Bombus vosnesenskii]XP_043584046.1 actin-binding LIM protein 3 isoform X7 [Bombus pyrosoma]XP_050481922.1 actin-binding LIM protein 3 isoform X8 [Bombus huntii]XP_060822241.1 actin-binding LIM protein 3 isoform X8 [Bombus pascuorum]
MKSKTSENFIASESNGVKRDQQLKQKQLKSGKTFCQSCKKKCSGEVLRVQDKYFHIGCFKCAQCNASLAQGGFFAREGSYYCTKDYRERWGTKCAGCGEYVEGDVVTAGDKHAFHPNCFHCQRCRQPLLGQGTKVSLVQGQALCHRCVGIPVREASTPVGNSSATRGSGDGPSDPGACAGCGNQLREGQALVALDRQWHVWCFKCHTCDTVLHGEYMGKDGVPYCEKDYQKQFGVKCAYCNRYISGKVLQAGDNHHFHPTCARCTKCGDPFGDGEEMYLQGAAIWHPRCGPGPSGPNGIVNGHGEAHTPQHRESERISSSASEMQYYPARTGSPGLILREYGRGPSEDVSRIYTYSYLTETPSQGYLRRPIQPYDKPPTSPHFHRPSSSRSIRSSGGRSSRSGMRALVDALSETRPKSPASQVDNDEPIELAHYPDAMKPPPGTKPPIERDDFPAPPYPYTDPERRRRWSDTYKGVPASDDEDEVDNKTYIKEVEEKLKKEQDELSKIDTGIAKVFLQDREKDRENLRHKAANVDPRNASRTPSAAREPTYRLRYESPVGASPSRNIDHARPWEDDDGFSYRSSVGPSYNVVSSLRHIPKPGYGLAPRSHTFSSTGGSVSALPGDYSFSGMGDKTHSTDFSSGKSDISTGSITDVDRRALNDGGMLPSSTTYTGGLGSVVGSHGGHHVRRSLPDMGTAPSEPPKLYPYHLLVITNYRLPADVDRCNLERHLSDAEFEAVLQFTRAEFYRLPQWRRNEIKRRARLF